MTIQLLQPFTRCGLHDYLIVRQDADQAVKGAAWLTSIALRFVSCVQEAMLAKLFGFKSLALRTVT